MTVDAGAPKQITKVGEINDVIETIRNISIDIQGKAIELTSSSSPTQETSKETAAENVGNALLASLREIRGILQEAYETLSAFV